MSKLSHLGYLLDDIVSLHIPTSLEALHFLWAAHDNQTSLVFTVIDRKEPLFLVDCLFGFFAALVCCLLCVLPSLLSGFHFGSVRIAPIQCAAQFCSNGGFGEPLSFRMVETIKVVSVKRQCRFNRGKIGIRYSHDGKPCSRRQRGGLRCHNFGSHCQNVKR